MSWLCNYVTWWLCHFVFLSFCNFVTLWTINGLISLLPCIRLGQKIFCIHLGKMFLFFYLEQGPVLPGAKKRWFDGWKKDIGASDARSRYSSTLNRYGNFFLILILYGMDGWMDGCKSHFKKQILDLIASNRLLSDLPIVVVDFFDEEV